MSGEEEQETRVAIIKMKRVCSIIRATCLICIIVFVLVWFLSIGFSIYEVMNSEQPQIGFKEVTYLVLTGLLTISLLIVALKVFSSIVDGEMPFSKKQVKRLWITGALFLVYAVSDTLVSVAFSIGTVAQEYYLIIDASNSAESSIIDVNLPAILMALVCFGLAVIFKYGVLLQEFNDDAL